MTLFYCPEISNGIGVFSPVESAHCIRVLRRRKGDAIEVTEGKGLIYNALITSDDPLRCTFEVTGINNEITKRPYTVHIAISPLKNTGRFEWFLEKACEIGVDRITPLLCERTERTGINSERMMKILISSVKQAVVPVLPVLDNATGLKDLILQVKTIYSIKLIGYCNGIKKQSVPSVYGKGSDVIFLIGPEGDFTSDEVAIAVNNGFIPVSLGDSRLRTETAGIVACTAISILNS